MTSVNLDEFFENADRARYENGTLEDTANALKDSIRVELEAITAEQARNNSIMAGEAVAVIEADGPRMLADPETAGRIYEIAYNNGQELPGFRHAVAAALHPGEYAPMTGEWILGDTLNREAPVLVAAIHLTESTSDSYCDDRAARLEPILSAQRTILAPYRLEPHILAGLTEGWDEIWVQSRPEVGKWDVLIVEKYNPENPYLLYSKDTIADAFKAVVRYW